ncbi:MAG TPA: condensation domain-containing protein [Herpetosiphonaceae bacterium]
MDMDRLRAADLSADDQELFDYLLEEEGLEVTPRQAMAPPMQPSSLPLSVAQQRLWFFDQLQPGNTLYTIPVGVRIRGDLNLPALQQSPNTVIRRHAILRTSFRADPTASAPTPYQHIAPAQDLRVTPVRFPSAATATAIQQVVTAAQQQPFDLQLGPVRA